MNGFLGPNSIIVVYMDPLGKRFWRFGLSSSSCGKGVPRGFVYTGGLHVKTRVSNVGFEALGLGPILIYDYMYSGTIKGLSSGGRRLPRFRLGFLGALSFRNSSQMHTTHMAVTT